MSIYHDIIILCWAVFLVVWGISALQAKRTIGSFWRGIFIRLALAAVVAFILSQNIFQSIQIRNYFNPTLGMIGDVLGVLGIGFAIWARVNLGRNWGMPRSIKENPELVTTGPYAYVRHPIYTGLILALLGTALVVGPAWLIICAAVTTHFIYSAIAEERIMLREFPESYPEYMQRSKMLIPFIF